MVNSLRGKRLTHFNRLLRSKETMETIILRKILTAVKERKGVEIIIRNCIIKVFVF